MPTKTQKKSTFASRLRAARLKAGLTHAALAERAGVSLDYVYRLQRGQNEPGAQALAALCRALNVSADELLGLKT